MKWQLVIKRFFDIAISIMILLITSPILFLISILIKFDSKGPILFKQERIGKNGLTFSIYKFRTMIINAEKIGDGLSIKSNSDPRITKLGAFLRRTSLDELPQLFNVLNGSMSLVGPRPPVTYHPYNGFDNYPSWAKNRFLMLPGITGLTQVTVRNSVSWDDRIRVDLQYIEKFNLLLDIKILFMTLVRVIKPKNIYN